MKRNYDDIINLEHHVSQKHPQMSLDARAAQFAPFAALTGFDEQLKEAERLTNERKFINEDLREKLDNKLQIIQKQISVKPTITVTYFVHDLRKQGGSYRTVIGKVKKIDKYKNVVILENKTEIPIEEIIDINSNLFESCDII